MISIGIVGATGYTGIELIRLLLGHPEASITVLTSDSQAGDKVNQVFPSLSTALDLTYQPHATSALSDCDVIFLATPHAVAMNMVPGLLSDGKLIIDLSADYRIKDVELWEQNYGITHASPDLIQQAVYGLPELNREAIKQAQLIANPGCYPTAISLALLPAIQNQLIAPDSIIADAKSGVSGAGRKADIHTAFAEVNENFKAYGLAGHRHHAEISEVLNSVAEQAVQLSFVPHLLPVNRGILATIYVQATTHNNLTDVYRDAYQAEPFVDILDAGQSPQLRSVAGSNQCQISINPDPYQDRVVIVSVIDNLVKGAAGQAIQNMNIRLGFAETLGLSATGFYP